MSLQTINVNQNPAQFAQVGRHFRLVSGAQVHARFYLQSGKAVETSLVEGLGVDFPEMFTHIDISSDVDQQAVIWASTAKLTDDRKPQDAKAAAMLGYTVTATPVDGRITLLSSNESRVNALIKVMSGTVYMGGETMTESDSMLLETAESITTECQGAIYIMAKSDAVIRVLEERN